MQDKEIFDFLKGLFVGLDFNNDAQYQQAIQQITSNPYLPIERKYSLLNQIDYEYHYRKEQIKKAHATKKHSALREFFSFESKNIVNDLAK